MPQSPKPTTFANCSEQLGLIKTVDVDVHPELSFFRWIELKGKLDKNDDFIFRDAPAFLTKRRGEQAVPACGFNPLLPKTKKAINVFFLLLTRGVVRRFAAKHVSRRIMRFRDFDSLVIRVLRVLRFFFSPFAAPKPLADLLIWDLRAHPAEPPNHPARP